MSFQNCGVVFYDSPQGVLYSGRRVSGAFQIRQDEPKKIQGLTFKVTGETRTRWSVSRGSGRNRRSVTFYGRQIYFDTIPVTLIGGYQTQHGSVVIDAGLSTFNFSFTLPQGIPSSFEGTYGKIRYTLKVIAKRANKFDKSRKFPFTVICSSDLNLNPVNRMPITRVMAKEFSLFFVNKGSLEVTIDLPMAGYVPGQQLPIKCLVKNNSKVLITSIIFCLERFVTYVTMYPNKNKRTEINKIVQVVGHQIEKESESQLDVALSIPALPPSSIKEALIMMEYFVKVRAIVAGMHSNVKTAVPVKIGTVPVRSQNYADPSTSTAFRRPQIDISSTANYPSCPDLSPYPGPDTLAFPRPGVPSFLSPQHPSSRNSHLPPFRSLHNFPPPTPPPPYSDLEDMDLPTYEESQMSAKMIEDDPEDEDSGVVYSPRYPVFQFPTEKPNP